jgi:tripartite-type tricarboxylate transporter receptor subunit TctC
VQIWVRMSFIVIWSALLVAGGSLSARAESAAQFFHGKTITIQVGYGPGGGYDLTARLLAQYYGKHIPGNPRIIVEDMPGGGGLTVANEIYNTATPDGLTLGVFASDVALEPMYGNDEAKFQPARFSWIGSMDTDLQGCAVWRGAGEGIKTLPDLLKAKRRIKFGASSPVSDTSVYPLFLKNVLKAPIDVIHGYSGTQTIMLAMQNQEVDGVCGIFESSIRGTYKQNVAAGDLNVFAQIVLGDERSTVFAEATPIMSVVKGDRFKAIANFLFIPSLLARPLAAPPGTPQDRVDALRTALLATESDPETRAAAERAGLTLKPKSGQEVEGMIRQLQATPEDIVKAAYAYTH